MSKNERHTCIPSFLPLITLSLTHPPLVRHDIQRVGVSQGSASRSQECVCRCTDWGHREERNGDDVRLEKSRVLLVFCIIMHTLPNMRTLHFILLCAILLCLLHFSSSAPSSPHPIPLYSTINHDSSIPLPQPNIRTLRLQREELDTALQAALDDQDARHKVTLKVRDHCT